LTLTIDFKKMDFKNLNDIISLTLSSFSMARLIFFSNSHRNTIKCFVYFLEFLLLSIIQGVSKFANSEFRAL
jgi:hypothetical protein